MTKTVTIAEAEQQLTTASEHLAGLKAKILDKGPGAVSPEELGDAAHAVEHARLTVQHAAEAAEADAKRQRLAQLEEYKAAILAEAGDPDDAIDAMRQLREATALLIAACANRQHVIGKGMATMRRAGVPRYEAGGKRTTQADGRTFGPATELTDQHAGMGWREAGMGHSDTLFIDDRTIGAINPGLLVAACLAGGARDAGYGVGYLAPVVDVHGADQAAIDNPEAWLKARY